MHFFLRTSSKHKFCYHQQLCGMCLSRLPGEVLVCWGWHSSDLQQLHACPVPLRPVRPEQDGHLCRGRQIPERRPRRRAEGQCRLAGERHPVGILRNDCKHLELSTRPRACVCGCVLFLSGWMWWGGKLMLKAKGHGIKALLVFFILLIFFFLLKQSVFTGLAGDLD